MSASISCVSGRNRQKTSIAEDSIAEDSTLTLITEGGTRFDILFAGESIQIFLIAKELKTMRVAPQGPNTIKLEAR